MHDLLIKVRRKKLVRWTVAYLAAAWLLAQVLALVGQQFGWPAGLQRGITVFLGCGVLVAVALAWYHGERGVQRVTLAESALVPALLVLAAGMAWWAARGPADGPAERQSQPAGAQVTATTKSSPSSDTTTLAVLPFENRSASGEDAQFLAEGIHEDLIGALSRVPGLKVMSRMAVLPYRDNRTSLRQIAAELSAGSLVGGSVRRAGDRVRVSVQLVRASDQATLWAEQYDRTLSADSVLALQAEITAAIARALALRLEPGNEAARAPGMTANTAAYEAFLRGRQAWNANSQRGDQDSVLLFQKAIAIDPDFATAYGALAESYVSLGNDAVEPPARVFPLARAAAERALAIDERIVQAHTALAEIAFHYDWNWAESDRHIRRALALDPNYVTAYTRLSSHLAAVRRFDAAIAAARQARSLDPLARNASMAEVLLIAGRYQDALAAAREETNLLSPSSLNGINLGLALYLTGQRAEALRTLEKSAAAHPDDDWVASALGWLYGRTGRSDQAMAIYRRLRDAGHTRLVSPLRLAEIAAGTGDADLAMANLDRGYALHEPMLPAIGTSVLFEPVRTDPRFTKLLDRVGLGAFYPAAASK